LRYCPACLELNDCRKEGKRRVLYFMPLHESAPSSSGTMQAASTAESKEELQIDASCPRLRAYSEIAKVLPLCSIPRMYKNKRLSHNEKRRRQIVETYRAAEKHISPAQITKLNHFLGQVSEADRAFLSGNLAVQHRSRVSRPQPSSNQNQAGQPVVED